MQEFFNKVLILLLIAFFFTACKQDTKKDVDNKEVKESKKQSVTVEETQEETPDDQRIQLLKEEAKKRFEEEIKKEPEFDFDGAKQKYFLQRYRIDITEIPQEQKTKEQLQQIIQNLVSEATSLKFPESKQQEVIEQAEKEFPSFKEGDLVEVKTRRGSVYGMLERIYPNKIKIEKFYILLDDIVFPHAACFNETECRKRRNHFIRLNYEIPKDDFRKKCEQDFAPNIYKEEGFILVGKNWISVNELFEKKVGPELRELEKKYKTHLEEKVRKRVEEQMRQEGLYED